MPESEPVIVGRVSGLFGVRGWVKVYSYTDPREALLQYAPWLIRKDGEWRRVEVEAGKRHGKSVIAQLQGWDDRDAAAELLDCDIGVLRETLPEPAEGQYYWRDLEGLEVRHVDGTLLGIVNYVLETGANDVLVTRGDRERLVPFVQGDVVKDVDLVAGVISVDWEWE